ncbi:hypothetical protein K3495_g6982 [Podosphaera aphanis]|nr:hypothetical protein K3495_g6982 [Podosphaera aphanis]
MKSQKLSKAQPLRKTVDIPKVKKTKSKRKITLENSPHTQVPETTLKVSSNSKSAEISEDNIIPELLPSPKGPQNSNSETFQLGKLDQIGETADKECEKRMWKLLNPKMETLKLWNVILTMIINHL